MATEKQKLVETTEFYFNAYDKKPEYNLPVPLEKKELDAKMTRIGEVVKERAEAAIKRKEAQAKAKQKESALDEELETLAEELASKQKIENVKCKWDIDFEKRTANLVRLDTKEVVKKNVRLDTWQLNQARQKDAFEDDPPAATKIGNGKLDEAQPG